jgi:hypothetical protein
MAKPSLHQMGRHIRLEGADAEAVAQTLGHGWRTSDPGRCHHLFNASPCRRSAETPNPLICYRGIALRDAQIALPVKLIEQVTRQRHLPDDAGLAALQSLDARYAALDVDRCRRERMRTCSCYRAAIFSCRNSSRPRNAKQWSIKRALALAPISGSNLAITFSIASTSRSISGLSPHSPDDALSFGTDGAISDIGISSLFWIVRGCHGESGG